MYIYIAENHSADFSSVLQFIELTITPSMLLSVFFLVMAFLKTDTIKSIPVIHLMSWA